METYGFNAKFGLLTKAGLDLRRILTAISRWRSPLIIVICSCTDPKIKSFKS